MPLTTLALLLASTAYGPQADPLDVSFAFFGCNRIDKKDWEETRKTNPSSANVAQLQRTFADLAALKPVPNLVFGGGDLVLNYADDQGQVLQEQLDGWQKQFFASPLAGKTTMVPFPGNHEMNKKTSAGKVPNPATIDVWNKWYDQSGFKQMATNGPDGKGSNPDRVTGDQRRLSYSFDVKSVHFVVLNTDTLMSESKVAWIPAEWARADIEKAQHNPAVKSIFILGHRNLVDPKVCTGDSPIDAQPGQKLLQAIRMNSKVRAYVCAHVHAWDLDPLGGPSKAWQVVAGNGGSQLEEDWKPATGTFFGFVVIDVYRSGKVVLRNFKRPIPQEPLHYNQGTPPPAKPVDTVLYDPVK